VESYAQEISAPIVITSAKVPFPFIDELFTAFAQPVAESEVIASALY
jgi:hypothetical protein